MIKRLYDKNELTFSLWFIAAYIVLFSLADLISNTLGIAKIVTAAVGALAVLFV